MEVHDGEGGASARLNLRDCEVATQAHVRRSIPDRESRTARKSLAALFKPTPARMSTERSLLMKYTSPLTAMCRMPLPIRQDKRHPTRQTPRDPAGRSRRP